MGTDALQIASEVCLKLWGSPRIPISSWEYCEDTLIDSRSRPLNMKCCAYCHRTFHKTEHLHRHQRSHTGEKPFSCPECGRRYARRDVLQRHFKNFHNQNGGVPIEQRKSPDDVSDVHDQSYLQHEQSCQTTLHSAADLGRQSDWSHSSTANELSQHQFSVIDDANMAETQLPAEMFDFQSTITNLFEFIDLSSRNSPVNTQSSQLFSKDRASTIPAERFAQVARLWPHRMGEDSAEKFRVNLWANVVRFRGDNICMDLSILETSSPLSVSDQTESKWGLDEEKRQSLIHEFALSSHTREVVGYQGGGMSTPSFPPTRLLNIGLDVAFRQPHSLLPYIHRPTFSAKSASNSIVLSLCILGLAMLDSKPAKDFTIAYLSIATEKCCTNLVQLFLEPEGSLGHISSLVSATLLLTAWSICSPKTTREELLVQMLHSQTISRFRIAGLFLPHQLGPLITLDLLGQGRTGDQAQTTQAMSNEALWKAWSRVESVKRLVATVVMLDAWWAYTLNISPGLSNQDLGLEMPGQDDLFRCASARIWRRLVDDGASILTDPASIQTRPPLVRLVATDSPSAIGISGLLSIVWIRVHEVRMQLLSPFVCEHTGLPVMPRTFHECEDSLKMIKQILGDIYAKYSGFLMLQNPNCIALWHFLNLNLLANVTVFELAAGHSGAESAHTALQEISNWCRTQDARRACLHAAGVYNAMSRRRTNDGTMLHSEVSLFIAALVLGLYVFMVQPGTESNMMDSCGGSVGSRDDIEPYELLDDIDWLTLRDISLATAAPASTVSSSSMITIDTSLESLAKRFVRCGGPVSFSGSICEGGYNAAKMILGEFASLLEDVGKWKEKQFCHILKIMSDSLFELDEY